MLIYNFQKEFLGIDEKDLRALGFKDLATLKTEAADFADLFVKTPGYIHNFKHVHWIDFITCADSHEEAKAIISVNSKNFKCTISITTAYLVESPTSKAYLIHLNNLRELTHQESEAISGDILERPIPKASEDKLLFNATNFDEEFNEPEEIINKTTIHDDPYETPLEIDLEIEDNIQNDDTDNEEYIEEIIYKDDNMLDVGDLSMDSDIYETFSKKEETFEDTYIYDPTVASEELGLPLDLIEEFIQDFITQAKEFKNDLYTSLDNGDIDNVKILSHKLKGVAANLRIEDAFEVLTTINTSSDTNTIKENIDTLYIIISKLAGEEPSIKTLADVQTDVAVINDADVPERIDVVELADDDFLRHEIEAKNVIKEDDETLELLEIEDSITQELNNYVEDKPITINYSKESIANEIGIDIDSFNELFNEYIISAKEIINSIKESVSNDDLSTSKHEALQLKGMNDNMRVSDFNNELEILIYSSNKDEMVKAINKIDTIFTQISKLGA
jgi:HPt (histidine-containing phosphotransfer) domain-containing protein